MAKFSEQEIKYLRPYGEEIEEILNDPTFSLKINIELSYAILLSINPSYPKPQKKIWAMAIRRAEKKTLKHINMQICLLSRIIPEFYPDQKLCIFSMLRKMDPTEKFDKPHTYSEDEKCKMKALMMEILLRQVA